jgi:hypothetical protein
VSLLFCATTTSTTRAGKKTNKLLKNSAHKVYKFMFVWCCCCVIFLSSSCFCNHDSIKTTSINGGNRRRPERHNKKNVVFLNFDGVRLRMDACLIIKPVIGAQIIIIPYGQKKHNRHKSNKTDIILERNEQRISATMFTLGNLIQFFPRESLGICWFQICSVT